MIEHSTLRIEPKQVAVRLEGGLGDHVLGMRVLAFVRQRFPCHDITIYSDSDGRQSPLQVAAMSPLVSSVVPVQSIPKNGDVIGTLENIRPSDLAMMLSADSFVDGWGGDMFMGAATTLNVPIFDILASHPELRIPSEGERCAADLLRDYAGAVFIGLNLDTDAAFRRRVGQRIAGVLSAIMECPNVGIVHFVSCGREFGDVSRREDVLEEAALVRSWCAGDARILTCEDAPVGVIAALLARCSYFIGVDNSIQRMAWGLGLPTTFFVAERPELLGMLRWLPDINRMLLVDASDVLVDSHIAMARSRLVGKSE